jgi:hypothetical protein
VVLTLTGVQLTTLSEMGIFRPSVTLHMVWLLPATWWMRKGTLTKAGGEAISPVDAWHPLSG